MPRLRKPPYIVSRRYELRCGVTSRSSERVKTFGSKVLEHYSSSIFHTTRVDLLGHIVERGSTPLDGFKTMLDCGNHRGEVNRGKRLRTNFGANKKYAIL